MKTRGAFAALVLMLCLSASALAGEAVWTFDGENDSVDGYAGPGGEVTIPATLEGCPSEILGDGLFYGNEALTGVVVPENCNAIERDAFSGCVNLTAVSLPETLRAVAGQAFYGCERLADIAIPAGVGYLGEGAFDGCVALRAVTFAGESPDMPGAGAFRGIAEDAVFFVPDDRLDAYRAALPEGADVRPSGRPAVTVDYASDEFDFDAAAGTITAYRGYAPVVAVPPEIGGVPVTALGKDAFAGHRYAYRVDLPEGVTVIGEGAFAGA